MTHTSLNIMNKPYHSRHRGSVIVYAAILMTIMLAMASLAVDYGHVQIVKSELQRQADATALGVIQYYVRLGMGPGGYSYATQVPAFVNLYNPNDGNSHVAATVSAPVWGYWDTINQKFVATGTYTISPVAVQVTISRTKANGNAVPLTFPLMSGSSPMRSTCDVTVTATAVNFGGATAIPTVGSQSDPWLAGAASGTTASDQDQAPAQSPTFVMNVVPGTYITITNVSGTVKHDPALSSDPATGDGGVAVHHMFDDSNGTAAQNGIGDIVAPLDCLIGVFIPNTAPTAASTPSIVRDYSTAAARDKTAYNDILQQQPFYIGTGKTSGGTTQTFRVPAGCTRMYMGPMDGHQWANNSGSFTATVTQSQDIQLVQ